jgi:hypothetical protein
MDRIKNLEREFKYFYGEDNIDFNKFNDLYPKFLSL